MPSLPTPEAPDWRADWEALAAVDWLRPRLQAMADCPQEPAHHGEGDVLAHTKLVVAALLADERFRRLDAERRQLLYLTALLHDVGKPQTTREEDGVLTSRGHSRRGAILARRLLWEAGLDPRLREQVCHLIQNHMLPFFLVGNEPLEARRRALEVSLTSGCDLLLLQASADARGRLSETSAELELNSELYAAYCEELGVLDRPYPFASDHSRFLYFRRPERDPAYAAYEQYRCRVTMMSGLPGSGKDSWLTNHEPELPVVSLDGIRQEIGVPATANQGPVIQLARERAREHLRAGRDFAWNSTNISRRHRDQQLALFAAYDARVRIVQVEVASDRHHEQNVGRGPQKAVPAAAIERMLEQWEAPSETECHELLVVGAV